MPVSVGIEFIKAPAFPDGRIDDGNGLYSAFGDSLTIPDDGVDEPLLDYEHPAGADTQKARKTDDPMSVGEGTKEPTFPDAQSRLRGDGIIRSAFEDVAAVPRRALPPLSSSSFPLSYVAP